MLSLEERADYKAGVNFGRKPGPVARKLFKKHVLSTGIKTKSSLSPFWRGWVSGFEGSKPVNQKFIETMRKKGITAFDESV